MASKRFSLLALPIAVASLALAACGGDDSGASAAGGDDRDRFREASLDFAQCMREQGVDMPDPKPDGGLVLKATPGTQGKVEAAQAACQKHLDGVKPPELSPDQEREFRERALDHARCMREHGVDVPDPTFGEGGRVQMRVPEGKGPEDPRFQEALRECGEPGGKPPSE